SKEDAIRNAGRLFQEGRAQAVKLEGGKEMADTVRAITRAGIPVMGHIGFTPQTVTQLSGYRIQGRSSNGAYAIYQDALALQEAGCIAIVLEMVPDRVATKISEALTIPTIGIGAGSGCDGQVLVYHDMLGIIDSDAPRFVKRYANLSTIITDALTSYIDDVENRTFPAQEHIYPIKDVAFDRFVTLVDSAEIQS
ncbi:MAG: 3-methyl-2-oxobutanoate hydroxymethyltransferase, partial [Candidatus Promineifilaceae bacterium]